MATCRCGWSVVGDHPCHGKGYECKKPAKVRYYEPHSRYSLAGMQLKLSVVETFACDECWEAFKPQVRDSRPILYLVNVSDEAHANLLEGAWGQEAIRAIRLSGRLKVQLREAQRDPNANYAIALGLEGGKVEVFYPRRSLKVVLSPEKVLDVVRPLLIPVS